MPSTHSPRTPTSQTSNGSADVEGMQTEPTAAGVEVGDLTHPFYMPAGEFRAEDPDGYVLLVGQADDA